ncbi:histone acetyltransferase HPA2 [Vibrio ishigakensis]|uniref:Histone acetyltransferase HPA2 n=1 Tax=Vibrio ishigakensis TaxID=1481914 RepID=A0A0B8NX99_9VIBR|nr:GNAT family N-acetyltransferase [Vibrio ishigakensis]GAM59180.1 histone acetyltransferase HPA2 [Vibrio ishigakensis]
MSDISKVRIATPNDAEALLPLWLDLYRFHIAELGGKLNRAEVETQLNNYLSHPECLHFLAQRNDEVVGFVAGELSRFSSPLKPSSYIGSIDHWYVAKDARKLGIGRALLEKIELAFAGLGAQKVQVEVWDFNKNALKYYQKQGYRAHIQVLEKTL